MQNRNVSHKIHNLSPLFLIGFMVLFISCKKDEVKNQDTAVVASFTKSVSGTLPVIVQFSNISTGTAGSVFDWNFGDGSTSDLSSPTHGYNSFGVFAVKLVQTNNLGVKDSVTRQVMISATGKSGGISGADFSYSVAPAAPYTVTFHNTSTNATSFVWDFGDGYAIESTDLIIFHTYPMPGTYLIELKAFGSSGVDSLSHQIILN